MQIYKNYGKNDILINSKINLKNSYARSHYETEKIIKKIFFKKKNMFVILRLGNVFGFRKYFNLNGFKNNIIHELCNSSLRFNKIIVKNGTIQRTFIPSKIFVNIIDMIIKKKIYNNSIINISYKVYNLITNMLTKLATRTNMQAGKKNLAAASKVKTNMLTPLQKMSFGHGPYNPLSYKSHLVPEELPTTEADRQLMQAPDLMTAWGPSGCEACMGTGYAGRIGVFELLQVDSELREMVLQDLSERKLRAYAREQGLVTLQEDGLAKVRAGLSSVEEYRRVLNF